MSNKSKIYVVVLIWAAALMQLFINSSINREEKMVEQAMSSSVDNMMEGTVKAYAYYGRQELSDKGREVIARNLAEKLGIIAGYEIETRTEGENKTTAFTKIGQQADTKIKVISLCETDKYNQPIEENYIMIEINLKGTNGSAAYEYKEKLDDIYEELGMEPNTNVYLLSQHPGELSEAEMDNITDKFLDITDATMVDMVEFDGVRTVYGYSNGIKQYVFQEDNRVNVNIAFTYDKEQDVTYIHRGVPFIDKSF